MPTYGRPEYISRAINSILAQTYTDWELIVIDDNPHDSLNRIETEKVVKRYTDSRIKYIQNAENMGGAKARNVGIFASNGEYITFLDDDDMYLPEKLNVQYKEMLANDWDVCVMDGATYSFEDDSLLTVRHQRIKPGMTVEDLMRVHLIYHITGTNSFMFKSNFIKQIGGFEDIPSCQEYILMQKALDAKPNFGYIPQILIRNYMHSGEQISTGIKKLKGQLIMYDNKKRYFHLLSNKERRSVRCRHHGVLFFVNYKMKNYIKSLYEAILCFISSPTDAIKWYKEYHDKIS